MKKVLIAAMMAFMPAMVLAQAPAGAPAGSTGQCKDGSYTSVAKKAGACRGHQGVQAWYSADTSAATPSKTAGNSGSMAPKGNTAMSPKSTPGQTTTAQAPHEPVAPAATPQPKAKVTNTPPAAPSTTVPIKKTTKSAKTPMPGGGPGLVWVNTNSKVYHCYNTEDYGTTKAGKYMSEADAKAMGARPDAGKACSK